jgi:stage V sporulation protein D (sporulation-specific penicillin-binding protein)
VHISNYRRRVEAVFLCFFLVLILSIARLFFIQLFRSNYLKNIARKQHNLFVELEPRRGTIYDINLRPQAVNISADSLYACPNDIDNNSKETIIRQLSPILKVNDSYLRERLFRKKAFVWLSRKVESDQSQAIRKLKIKGVDFLKESKRCYPNSYLASNIIGFAGLDNVGLEGAELYYDKYLKGESGWEMFVRDARQKKLNLREKMLLPRDGYDLVLTIDEVIQYIAERELDKAFKIYHAKGAIIIVMNPYTGEILAMADRPSYDLNEYAKAEKDTKRNRAISDLFEPGSVFKIVTASAAIEEKMVSEEDKFFCENGVYKVGSHTLHDHRPHGWLTFREVIEQSSNIGTTKVAQGLGDSVLYRYIKLFGFGTKTDFRHDKRAAPMV